MSFIRPAVPPFGRKGLDRPSVVRVKLAYGPDEYVLTSQLADGRLRWLDVYTWASRPTNGRVHRANIVREKE